jgi:hypothetical protein
MEDNRLLDTTFPLLALRDYNGLLFINRILIKSPFLELCFPGTCTEFTISNFV